ncbi:hypothetical protein [Xenorhabdus anantnagensis]|uniref:Uncharacterized protein n=1 Tax=Xenorhabdus anantnagensis TaxID=3025875 RepID=A0ABT5LTS0_9GAMM|nr:hypothetical protein [Xenorhabdus anantnagensis]MDC9597825.1 hypothetical protein [Xenorhabdus anantnagensis]
MQLPPEKVDTAEQLAEFDQWLTAKLERIKDSNKFTSEINSLCDCIQHIAPFLDNFSDHKSCGIDNLCCAVIQASCSFLSGEDFFEDELKIANFYDAFFNLLFLTSGATDNNLKNHFLIKLKDDEVNPLIPKRGLGKKIIKFQLIELPSTTKSDMIAKLLSSCYVGSRVEYADKIRTEPIFNLQTYLELFLKEYVSLILEDSEEVMQFWAICRSYISLSRISDDIDFGRYLLNSCTIFKVRGSVSASGGHITEDILREKLDEMGLRPELDYNINDVAIGEQEVVEDGKRKKKTRAYDFILPYDIDGWEPKPKLFIQSQFYAGDSGSVSHKVVDQTESSRQFTLKKYANARFVEYLDGAGYYASLRGDLAHMLSLDSTASFFQVKSILIRLRREFQNIKFITPIEFEHALLMTDKHSREDVFALLMREGYPKDEVERAEKASIGSGYISLNSGIYQIAKQRIIIARRLLILDVAASNVSKISDEERNSQKYLLVPGYGPNMAILESTLSKLVCDIIKAIRITPYDFSSDIEWLLDEGVMKRR